MGGRSAVPVALSLWVGMAAAAVVPGSAWLLIFVPALALTLVRLPRAGNAALLAAVVVAGAARSAAHQEHVRAARAWLADGDALVRIDGVIVEPPARESGEPLVRVAVRSAHRPVPRGAAVRLRLDAGVAVEWSDHISGLARLDRPEPPRNPGGLDALAVAGAASTIASGRLHAARVAPAGGWAGWPRGTFARWRSWIERRLERGLGPAARELVVPLVLGDRTGMEVETSARLRASGLIHLIALSGLHVSWMAGAARLAVAAAGGGVAARAVAGAACAVLYAGIAGPIPSLLRAAAAEILTSLARLTARAVDPLQTLALSAVVLLSLFPGWGSDLGFQLSCAATLGLVTVGAVPVATGGSGVRTRSVAVAPLLRALAGSIGAQLVAMPLLLARFHAVPWVAPMANLVAVPVSALLLAAAWVAVLAEGVVPGAGRLPLHACEVLARVLERVVAAAASLPGTGWGARSDGGVVAVAAAGAAALACASLPPRGLPRPFDPAFEWRRAAAACAGIAATVAVLLLAYTSAPRTPPPGTAWVVALDVGQGDAIALAFVDGWWLVDAGPRTPRWDAGEAAVLPFLRWAGVRRLERLVLTHDDADHTGGAAAILRALAAGAVVAPPSLPRRPGTPGARALVARGGDTLRAEPVVRVVWPPRSPLGAVAAARSPDNAAGLVLEVGEGRGRALLLADVDSTVEVRLPVESGPALLKVAHHGSGSSSGAAFLTRLRPATAVVSCGRRNAFGHPNAGALERIRGCGARIERTDREGALWYELTPDGARRVHWRGAGRRAAAPDVAALPPPWAPRQR